MEVAVEAEARYEEVAVVFTTTYLDDGGEGCVVIDALKIEYLL